MWDELSTLDIRSVSFLIHHAHERMDPEEKISKTYGLYFVSAGEYIVDQDSNIKCLWCQSLFLHQVYLNTNWPKQNI